MANEKQYDIFDMLVDKTSKSEINWQGTFDDNIFAADYRGYTFQIGPESFDRPDTYFITITNNAGKRLETFSDVELHTSQGLFPNISYKNYRQEFTKLYEAVRRQVLNVDDALDDILKEWKK